MPTLPDGERAQAWLRLSQLYGDKLAPAEYALTSLDEALKLDAGACRGAAELRIGLYKRLERWSELQQALRRRRALRRAGRGAGVAPRRQRRGRRRRIARRSTKEPAAHEARAALENLLRKPSEWRELAAVLDERVQYADAAKRRARSRPRRRRCSPIGSTIARRRIARYEALAD